MRVYKFRVWDRSINNWLNGSSYSITGDGGILLFCDVGYDEKDWEEFDPNDVGTEIMQYTGLKDKNGIEIYEGDLLNVFFTSYEGEHNHDCIYEVIINPLEGLTLLFRALFWESFGYNQYPSTTTLNSKYHKLDYDYRNGNYGKLAVCDSWDENHLLKTQWKVNDYSNYIEVIGNIYENPELLRGHDGH